MVVLCAQIEKQAEEEAENRETVQKQKEKRKRHEEETREVRVNRKENFRKRSADVRSTIAIMRFNEQGKNPCKGMSTGQMTVNKESEQQNKG